MRRCYISLYAAVCVVAFMTLADSPTRAQEIKEKPPMYSYVANWQIPRSQWGDVEKTNAADQKILDKALASGTIVGYGNDENLVHQPEGETHDNFWSSMSMAGLLNVLDEFYKSPTIASPVLANATKHWDSIYVSRYYNWHAGSFKDAYTYVAFYKLKESAPDDAVDTLAKNLIAPLLEKMISEGAVVEYEIDTQTIHTENPNSFLIAYITPNGEGIDKVNAAIRATLKANPLGGPAFDSMVDYSAHRDELLRTNATYK
ncbi:MAG TPA: hypothetical protein VJO35_11795 [Terriglobales bacterium]|nr:hypothetical protein [Terriglobales bacterium]